MIEFNPIGTIDSLTHQHVLPSAFVLIHNLTVLHVNRRKMAKLFYELENYTRFKMEKTASIRTIHSKSIVLDNSWCRLVCTVTHLHENCIFLAHNGDCVLDNGVIRTYFQRNTVVLSRQPNMAVRN